MQERDVWFDHKSHSWALWVDLPTHPSTTKSDREVYDSSKLVACLPSWLAGKLGMLPSSASTQPPLGPTLDSSKASTPPNVATTTKSAKNQRMRLLYAQTRGKSVTLHQVNLRNMSKGPFLARTKDFAWLHDFARSTRVLCIAKVCFSKPPVIQECALVGWVAEVCSSHVKLANLHACFFVSVADVAGLDLSVNTKVSFELRCEQGRFVPCNIAQLCLSF